MFLEVKSGNIINRVQKICKKRKFNRKVMNNKVRMVLKSRLKLRKKLKI